MAEPQFRFCKSADGTRIAYMTYGEGPRLLYVQTILSVDSALTIPESRAFLDALASRMTLAMCDRRGVGASGGEIDDIRLDTDAEDIVAVADSLGWQDFALFAINAAIVPIVEYVSVHPERVTRLIWWNTVYAGMVSRHDEGEYARAAHAAGADYSNYRRRAVSSFFPDGPVRLQREYGSAWKAATSAEEAARFADRLAEARADDFLPPVTTSALVLARSARAGEKATVMRMAGLLPNGEVRFVAGNSGEPFPDHEPVVEAIAEFMGLGARPQSTPSGMAVVLFTDIVDSTALTERLGDTVFRTASRALDEGMRAAIGDAGGTPVDGKLLGDGVMGVFTSASQAIDAARRCIALSAASELQLHVGLHAGDVIHEKGNVYGGAVNIASRICGLSAPGEVLVSDIVRGLARTSAGVEFEDRGEQALKGIDDAVRVYEVRWRE
jgi:class 3 adenylate cyclase